MISVQKLILNHFFLVDEEKTRVVDDYVDIERERTKHEYEWTTNEDFKFS